MDDADRLKAEQEQYTRNLEGLVKSRTDQLQQEVRKNGELQRCLKQILFLESLEQVREAAQACIRKFESEPGSDIYRVTT